MKNILLLLALLFTVLGCAERYDGDINFLDCREKDAHSGEFPHIVSIDPPQEEIARDLLGEPYPPRVIKLKRGEDETITVTFSSPPQGLFARSVQDYILQDRTLTMNVYCYMTRLEHIHDIHDIYIEWEGGAALLLLWCPPEENK